MKTHQSIEVISHNYYRDENNDIHAILTNYYKGFEKPYTTCHTINHKTVNQMSDTAKAPLVKFEKQIVKEFKLKKIGG